MAIWPHLLPGWLAGPTAAVLTSSRAGSATGGCTDVSLFSVLMLLRQKLLAGQAEQLEVWQGQQTALVVLGALSKKNAAPDRHDSIES